MLETLAQESYDMITLLPTYIENTRAAILALGNDTKNQFREVESLLVDDTADGGKQSLKTVLKSTEDNILQASSELKQIVVESGNMAESLFERVDSGYKELEVSQNFILSFYTNRNFNRCKIHSIIANNWAKIWICLDSSE